MKNNFVALIPARGGSKGLKRKNILNFYNKPLLAWSIEFAKKTNIFSRCIVSTDDYEISNIAKKYGAEIPYIREKKLASDKSSSSSVILDFFEKCSIDDDTFLVLLEPTSPFRRLKYIDQILSLIKNEKAEKILSMFSANSSSYSYQYKIDKFSKIVPLKFNEDKTKVIRRQDLNPTFFSDGCFYVTKVSSFKEDNSFFTRNTFSIKSDLFSSLEIDDLDDFKLIEAIFKIYGPPF